jgi:general stress protein 26
MATDREQLSDEIKKLREMIQDVKVAMLTTVDVDGSMRSRPMRTQEVEFDGDLWFFTDDTSPKTEEILRDRHVNVTYSDPNAQRYVSVKGQASLVRDKTKMAALWSPIYKAWFPDGLDDPNICLLRVEVDSAEYWDSSQSAIVHAIGFTKAALTGERYKPGENAKIDLR